MAERVHDRQRLLPGWDQDRLAAATAVVAGVGALGNEVAKNLALAGVGRLILCDPDTVSPANLDRTVLFSSADLGDAKAGTAARRLRRIAPGTEVEARVAPLVSGVGTGELADAALVVGCVDTLRARMQLLGRCALVGAALVDGGTHPWGGEVRLRLSPDEPCHGCSLTEHQRGHGDLPWSCFEPRADGPEPSSIAATALVAGWMTTAALELLMGRRPAWRFLAVESAGRAGPVEVARDPGCPYHHPWEGPPDRVAATDRATVAEFLAELADGDEPETWAEFPLPPRCRVCEGGDGGRAAPRAGALTCEGCGALLRPVTSVRLRDADPGSELRELGVAPQEILPVRGAEGEHRCVRLNRG
ncbi:ThiF family adenylyltransferase [Actinomadura graeca]|uniref:ThiF family adenylyltransferase n=1 Tax=Actinomadura graeca TaxID=2750812 RepID=A0ABX8QS08_9ACTN|nr:ThiF family adenylyltransferase [Actinomadura graeca]QXJ20202.1 ThiF family adenylyltransferase [Actinomadura graeca]